MTLTCKIRDSEMRQASVAITTSCRSAVLGVMLLTPINRGRLGRYGHCTCGGCRRNSLSASPSWGNRELKVEKVPAEAGLRKRGSSNRRAANGHLVGRVRTNR
jgi:hypothetical protein